ncbi:hypothetical protein [Nonomuraea dietziae]|uniref:hypothetical protein n=1 Tax=Nonomuraea dietziae TaxID=65515 RepID=UPI0031E0A56D
MRLAGRRGRADRLRRSAGLPITSPTRHLVFTGNPGTAKTTVARLLASAYARLGLLSSASGSRSPTPTLIAEYLGQTAPKVRAGGRKGAGRRAVHRRGVRAHARRLAQLLRP